MWRGVLIVFLLVILAVISGCDSDFQSMLHQDELSNKDTALPNEKMSEENACEDFLFSVRDNQVTIDDVLTKEASVAIPDTLSGCTVIRIGDSAFYQKPCTHIQLPSTITSIGSNAFYRCDSLEQIIIPATTESIEGNPFFRCSALENIYVEKDNNYYCDVDGVLYNNDKTILIAFPEGKDINQYVIPEGVTTICDMAFGYTSNLKEIFIPDSVTQFPEYNLFELYDEICLVVVPGSAAEQYAAAFAIQTSFSIE